MAEAAPSSSSSLSSSTATHSMMETDGDSITTEKQQQKQQNQEQQEEEEEGPTLLPQHQDVTILALRMSSRKRLGMFLNTDAIPNAAGLLPNYQGLAELVGFEFIEQLSFQRERDPTMALLMEWGNRPELSPTLGGLVEHLSALERVDVLEDCRAMIRNDAEHYLKKKAAGSSEIKPVQDSTVSQSPFDIDDMKVDETAIMTIQDVEAGRPTYYDAFVCYHPEGADLQFVMEMIAKVECPPYNLRLFVPHRDDLPGASKYTISAKLIQERCKRMIIVMSPRYLQSDACDFQTKFAHALSPGSRSKKLVPVLIQNCPTPNILRHVTTCDYTRPDMNLWFWERLTKSLQAPLNPADIQVNTGADLNALQLNIRDPESASMVLPPMPPPTPTHQPPPTKGARRGGRGMGGEEEQQQEPATTTKTATTKPSSSSSTPPPSSSSLSSSSSPAYHLHHHHHQKGATVEAKESNLVASAAAASYSSSSSSSSMMMCSPVKNGGVGVRGGGGGFGGGGGGAGSPTKSGLLMMECGGGGGDGIQETSSGNNNNSPTNSLTKTKKKMKMKGGSQGAATLSPLSSSSPSSPSSSSSSSLHNTTTSTTTTTSLFSTPTAPGSPSSRIGSAGVDQQQQQQQQQQPKKKSLKSKVTALFSSSH